MLNKMAKINGGCIDCHTDITLLSPIAKRCRPCALKIKVRQQIRAYHVRKLKATRAVPTMLYYKYLTALHINIDWEYLITD